MFAAKQDLDHVSPRGCPFIVEYDTKIIYHYLSYKILLCFVQIFTSVTLARLTHIIPT